MQKTTNFQHERSGLETQLSSLLPASALMVFDSEATQMQAAFTSIVKLNEGDKAPDFTLPNATGRKVNLYDTLSDHLVLLVFYRGEWCPYCNLQLSILQKDLDLFQSKGIKLIAISPQNPDSTLTMVEKHHLRFEVLTDTKNIVAKKYTKVFTVSDQHLKMMDQLGYDFDSYYIDNLREIPVPAVFLIAKDGTVLFARSEGGDYRNRIETEEIIHLHF